MYRHEFMSTYLEEQMELNNEWYNLQKQLIYLENRAMIEGIPEKIITGIYSYIFGIEEYFKKMYDILKKEWNYFYIYYKKVNKEIKTYVKNNESLLKKSSMDLNFYGFNFQLDREITIEYTKLSPTDGRDALTINLVKGLTKSNNAKMKSKDLTQDNFDAIRGKILGEVSIEESKFRREIEKFYKGDSVKSLININSLKDVDMTQYNTLETLLSVKKEIDKFYNNVLNFLEECRKVQSINDKSYISGHKLNVKVKLINEYLLIKSIEFRNFAQIYNTFMLTLLTCVRDKMEQDKEIISLL